MEENVALDSSRQQQFIKSIKGIKKFMNKKSSNIEKVTTATKTIDGKRKKKKYHGKGLVYLSHIPHGFYEHQMTQYFKQFGRVTNTRVIRSKRTGNSKGCAFVEFSEPSVAQIVAETMNNYLMGKRLLKAVYIPPEKQRRNVFRKNWNSLSNPGADLRKKMNKSFNKVKTDLEEVKKARKLNARLLKIKRNLSDIGIDYGFFNPVDVPEFISPPKTLKKEGLVPKAETTEKLPKNEKINKKKEQKTDIKVTVEKVSKKVNKIDNIKEKKPDKVVTKILQKVKNKAAVKEEPETVEIVTVTKKKGKNGKEVPKIIPMENFITLNKNNKVDGSDDDDASDFDSDEFMRNLEEESSDGSLESDSDLEELEIDSDEEITEVKGNSKNKLPKQTPQAIKSKLNGNNKVNTFSIAEATVLKKKNKKPAQITDIKSKSVKGDQKELSRFSNKKKKIGAMKHGKKVKK